MTSSASPPWKAAALSALVAAVYGVVALRFLHVNLDDAYMLFRYAANLAGGRGLTYTMGERVEGSTGFLYVAVLAGSFKLLGLDVVEPSRVMWMSVVSKAIGAACGLGTLAYAGLVVRRVLDLPYAWVVASLLSLVLCESFVFSTTNGLETGLVCLLYAATSAHLYLWCSGGRRRGNLVAALVAACALVLCRADGVLLVAAIMASSVLFEWSARRPPPGRLARDALLLGVPPLAVEGGYFVFRYAYFGRWFPQSYYVKIWSPEALGHCTALVVAPEVPCATFGTERVWIIVRDYVLTAVWGYLALALLLAVYLALRRRDPRSDAHGYVARASPAAPTRLQSMLFFLLPCAPLLAYVSTTGDWMPGRRMLMHFLPLSIALLTGAGLRFAVTCAAPRAARATGVASVAALALGGAWTSEQRYDRWVYTCIYEVAHPEPATQPTYLSQAFSILRGAHDLGYYLTMYREFWADLAARVSPGDAVAVFESGYAPLALGEGVRVIDLSGLNDQRMSVPQDGEMYVNQMGRVYFTCGGDEPDPKRDYLLSFHPKFIVFDTFQMFWCKVFPTTLYGGRYRYVDVPHNELGFFSVYARSDLDLPGHASFPSYRSSPACMLWLTDEVDDRGVDARPGGGEKRR